MSRQTRKGDPFGSAESLNRGRDARVEQLVRERTAGPLRFALAVAWLALAAVMVWRVACGG